jgi:FKBP-type peptidyl-prolyl cis-trans isomerase
MKYSKFKILICVFVLNTINISAQQKPSSLNQPKTQVQIKLANETDSSQYILGAYLGQYINANNIAVTKPDLFLKGLDDVLKNKPLLVAADSIPKRMNELLTKVVIERGRILEKQLFDNVKGRPGVGNLPDGVCYLIVKAGTGARPLLTDSISMHVKGYLPEGKLFEDTYTKNTPFKTTPASLIEGLKETLQIMPSGSVWRIFIPSALAYGEKGVPGVIPAYSAVVFDVELLRIMK